MATGALTDTQLRATAVPVSGTIVDTVADGTASGTITANGQSVTLALPGGTSSTEFQFTGTFAGSVVFETSVDGGTTYNGRVYRGAGILNVLETGTSTFPSEWRGNSAGMSHLRVRCTAYTSGTLTVALRSSRGAGAVFLNAAMPIGGVSIGNLYSGALASGVAYTGTYERMTNVASVNVFVSSTQTGTLTVSFSPDQSTAQNVTFNITAGVPFDRAVAPRSEYFRASFTQSSGSSATVVIEVVYRAVAMQVPMLNMLDDVPSNSLAAANKSIIQGVNSWDPRAVNVTTSATRVDLGYAGRRSVMLRARSYTAAGDSIYVGKNSSVASATGIELKERESVVIDLTNTGQVWAVGTRAAGNTLEVVEIYDV